MTSLARSVFVMLGILAFPFFVIGFVARSIFLITAAGVLTGWQAQREFMDHV